MVRLRNCRKDDWSYLYELDQLCFSREIAYSKEELQYYLAHLGCSCWIAEESGGEVAGFLILERIPRHGRIAGHIITVDVAPARRRHGVGRLLMETAQRQMKEEGAFLLTLELAVNNHAAFAFYQRFGFEIAGRLSNYYPGHIDAQSMEKVI